MHVLVIGGGYLGTTQAAMLLTAGAPEPGVYGPHEDKTEHAVTVLEAIRHRAHALALGGVKHERGIAEVWSGALEHTEQVGWSHERHGVLRVIHLDDRSKVDLTTVDAVVVCVGTPGTTFDGLPSLDLSAVQGALLDLAAWRFGCGPCNKPLPVFVRSTMPPGAMNELQRHRAVEAAGLLLAHVPEFFTEGAAIESVCDDRRIIGIPEPHGDNQAVLLASLWLRILACDDDASAFLRMVEGGYLVAESAEANGATLVSANTSALAKLGTNYALSSRLTMANELALAAGGCGADAAKVLEIIGRDKRLGSRYLTPGCGWGGSCLPKDTGTVAGLLKRTGILKHRDSMAEQCVVTNETVINTWFADAWERITTHLHRENPDLTPESARMTWLGVTFKAGTDDMRMSPPMQTFEAWLHYLEAHKVPAPRIRVQDPETTRARIRQWLEGIFNAPRPELRADIFHWADEDGGEPPALADLTSTSHVVVLATDHRAYTSIEQGLLHPRVRPSPGAVLIDLRFAFTAHQIAELRARGWRYIRFGDIVPTNTPWSS